MNCKFAFIFAALLLIMVTATPFSLYAKEYHSSIRLTLQNECSSEDGGNTNRANNDAETYGDENVISPQITQTSQTKTGEDGQPGPGERGPPGPSDITESIHLAWHDNTPGNYEILYRNNEVIFEQSDSPDSAAGAAGYREGYDKYAYCPGGTADYCTGFVVGYDDGHNSARKVG